MENIIEPCSRCTKNNWSTVIGDYVWQCRTCGLIRKENWWTEQESVKWDRSLGTSKQEQGVLTPPPPRFRRTAQGNLRCRCLFRGKDLFQICNGHRVGLQLAEQIEPDMEKRWNMEQEQNKPVETAPEAAPAPKPEPNPGFPVENVATSESVKVELITPGETKDEATS